jgi:dephospho-CoA kinase
MKCIGLSGYARSGKDSVAAFLNDYGYERRAFADKLREALYRLNPTVKYKFWKIFSHRTSLQKLVDRKGWDWAKVHSSDVREYLQRMGTEVGREMFGANFWVDQAMKDRKT